MRIFLFNILSTAFLFSHELPHEEKESLARKIFFNECGNNPSKLLHWNAKEEFPSLGIGHFIWYTENHTGPFEETFPDFIRFLGMHHIPLPSWLFGSCPWEKQRAFQADLATEKQQFLKALLLATLPLQAEFIYQRFENSLEKILNSYTDLAQREAAKNKVALLQNSIQGRFALIDYIHFKGDGLSTTEQYQGKGWGLKQVLEAMPSNSQNPLNSFVLAAEELLKERVKNAPKERPETRWLQGWLNRIHRYCNG